MDQKMATVRRKGQAVKVKRGAILKHGADTWFVAGLGWWPRHRVPGIGNQAVRLSDDH
jgi:hypothetical protein